MLIGLFASERGEVLLVNDGAGAASTARSTATRSITTGTIATTTRSIATGTIATTTESVATATATATTFTTTAATAATGAITTATGLLNETHVDIEEGLLLALSLTASLLFLALDVGLFVLTTLDLLGGGPLLVGLGTLVGLAGLLQTEILALLLGLLGQVVGEGLDLLLGLGLLLLTGSLGLIRIALGEGLAGLLVIPSRFTTSVTPTLLNLLVGIAGRKSI